MRKLPSYLSLISRIKDVGLFQRRVISLPQVADALTMLGQSFFTAKADSLKVSTEYFSFHFVVKAEST